MKLVYKPELKAYLSIDEFNKVRSINHFEKYWPSKERCAYLAALDYLQQMEYVFNVPKAQLANVHQRASFLSPNEQGIEYRLSKEKQLFDAVTICFSQTYLNIPVWRSGFTVTMKQGPYRIIRAVHTGQAALRAKLPAPERIEQYKKLFAIASANRCIQGLELTEYKEDPETANFVRRLVDGRKNKSNFKEVEKNEKIRDNARLIRGKFFIYKFDKNERLSKYERRVNIEDSGNARKDEAEYMHISGDSPYPTLPLNPLPDEIKHGSDYLVAEVTFSYSTAEYGQLNWLALVELETESVIYLRPLRGNLNGMVFKVDPITATGDVLLTSDKSNDILNNCRTLDPLLNLDSPDEKDMQWLTGTYAAISKQFGDEPDPPSEPKDTDFIFNVHTWDFAAVNGYYHTDRFFTELENLGFPHKTYFSHTKFPIPVHYRAGFVGGACSGDGDDESGVEQGIESLAFGLSPPASWSDPVGRACDSRCVWHELGGHGILYEHVGSVKFGFCHSAGDSLSMIQHDPDSKAPDRFLYTIWIFADPNDHSICENAAVRRADRTVSEGWAWGGIYDDKEYGSEQILETTLFRVYLSVGGYSTDPERRRFASRIMQFIILEAVYTLTPDSNPENVLEFANALIAADAVKWTTEGVCGGAYGKVIQWSFEMQGLSFNEFGLDKPSLPTPVPDVDVYIDDGRGGEYTYQEVHWLNSSIWNRRKPDGKDSQDGQTHQEPKQDASNYAYVKIKNRGVNKATNVIVRGYHCRPSMGLIWPNDFQALTTEQISVSTLQGLNSEDKIIGPFEWTPVTNAYGHDCLLMIVSADGDASNVDKLALGESIPEWRLVPNDNNIGQRNVVPTPGGGGKKGLTEGLDGHSFWVGNPSQKISSMELRVKLPELLLSLDWRLSFKGIPGNRFDLVPGKQKKITMELQPGKEFDRNQVEKLKNRDILIEVLADGLLIGGMTYRLDPDISEPFNKRADKRKENGSKWLKEVRLRLLILILLLILLLLNAWLYLSKV